MRRSLKGTAATEWAAKRWEMLSHLTGAQQGSGSAGSLWKHGKMWGMKGSVQTLSLEDNLGFARSLVVISKEEII